VLGKNTTKEKLKAGQAVIGFSLAFASPDIIEMLSNIGFDFVYFDCEHGPMSEETCQDMVRAAELVGLTPIVRVTSNQPWFILRALDLGAMGIIVPHCNTKQEAQRAVEAAKYPPVGERGIAGRSLRLSGMLHADYIVEANKETMVIAMIEDAEAIDNLSQILAVDGLDVLLVGRADLSVSMGIAGQVNHPMIEEAVSRVITQGRAAGKAVGVGHLSVDDPESYRQFLRQGAQFFSVNSATLLRSVARQFLQKVKIGNLV
jgi:4-hydroxy-2-oxoheptanedioate aldolase